MKKFRKIISIAIAVIMLITVLPMATVSAGGDEHEITTNVPYEMWIGETGEIVSFSPDEDGWYIFYTTGDYDTWATLYNSNFDELAFADDTDYSSNFELKIKLYSGYTYFLEVCAYGLEDWETAKFDLFVEETLGAESANITKVPDLTTVVEGYEYETLNCAGMEIEFILTDGTEVDWSFDEGGYVAGSEVEISMDDDGYGHFYVDIICDEAFTRYFFDTIENPVDYFEYSGEPIVFYEGTCGYYNDDEGYYVYYYDFPYDSEVTVYYKDGTNKTFDFRDNILGTYVNIEYNQSTTPWVVGSNNFITLSLLGATVDVPVTILPVPFVNVTVDSAPTREYVFGDMEVGEINGDTFEFYPEDLTGLSFTVEYSDGTKKTYTDADFDKSTGMIDDYNFTISRIYCKNPGVCEGTFNYKGYDIKYNVNVVESPVADIEITKAPDRVEFEDIYYPLLYGMEIEVAFVDGTSDRVVLTEENVEYIIDGDLKYAVQIGEYTLYIYDGFDFDKDTYYSTVTCLGVKEDYYGVNYSIARDVANITAEKMSANGDGAVLNVEYENGDKEILTFETVDLYDLGDGIYEGYAMTDNGILYYSINTEYVDGEAVGYNFYTLNTYFYVDKSTTPEPEKPTEPSVPAVKPILGDADCDSKVNIKDATAIQKHIAGLITLSETGAKLADVDANGNVNIKDATAIQKHIAGMETGFQIGKEI